MFIHRQFHRRHASRDKIIHVDENKCARCRRCIQRCNHNVLDVEKNETGMRIVVKHPDMCSGCGNCMNVCNFDAIKLVDRL